MSNVLWEEKKQQVIALGRLGWSLRRIERAAHIRRETVGAYLRAAGIAVRPPGGWGHHQSNPAIEVSTDSETEKPPGRPGRSPSASACEPYREIIEAALAKGRNAMAIWQDLLDGHGFAGRYASVKWFVRKLCGTSTPEARVLIETAGHPTKLCGCGNWREIHQLNFGQENRCWKVSDIEESEWDRGIKARSTGQTSFGRCSATSKIYGIKTLSTT